MKNKAIGFVLIVFIYGALASALGWSITGNKSGEPKPREKLIDSIKIDSLTIKIYRDGAGD